MAKVYDIKMDNEDVVIANGDFIVDESTEQHFEDILLLEKGELTQKPLVGVAIRTQLNDEIVYSDSLKKTINKELVEDKVKVVDLKVQNLDKIQIIGTY